MFLFLSEITKFVWDYLIYVILFIIVIIAVILTFVLSEKFLKFVKLII